MFLVLAGVLPSVLKKVPWEATLFRIVGNRKFGLRKKGGRSTELISYDYAVKYGA